MGPGNEVVSCPDHTPRAETYVSLLGGCGLGTRLGNEAMFPDGRLSECLQDYFDAAVRILSLEKSTRGR